MSREEVVRPPAVSGQFYPEDPDELAALVDGYVDRVPESSASGQLRALVCPHAGYQYSGPTAGYAFRSLRGREYRRVAVLSPSHRLAFCGLAIPDCEAFATPLGPISLWSGCRALASRAPYLLDSRPHRMEHAIEVQLPFLQRTLGTFELIPIVFGACNGTLDPVTLLPLLHPDTLIVVSTDLSHYLEYDQARRIDQDTIAAVLDGDAASVSESDACGRAPLASLVALGKQRGWRATLLDYRNSGDTAGDKRRVVGYASLAFTEPD